MVSYARERFCRRALPAILVAGFWALPAVAQRGPGGGPDQQKDRAVYQFLLNERDAIERKVTFLPNGVETITESDDAAVADKIKEHVVAMKGRVEDNRPIRMRDSLFRAIFENAAAIRMDIQETQQGVRVLETSTDPYVVKLIQEHAKVVSNFIKYGHAEAQKNHPVPAP